MGHSTAGLARTTSETEHAGSTKHPIARMDATGRKWGLFGEALPFEARLEQWKAYQYGRAGMTIDLLYDLRTSRYAMRGCRRPFGACPLHHAHPCL
jgi:hypothetical protein